MPYRLNPPDPVQPELTFKDEGDYYQVYAYTPRAVQICEVWERVNPTECWADSIGLGWCIDREFLDYFTQSLTDGGIPYELA